MPITLSPMHSSHATYGYQSSHILPTLEINSTFRQHTAKQSQEYCATS